MPVLEYMSKGGPLMWLIVFCSVLASAVFLERVIYFHRVTVKVGEFMRGIGNLVRRERYTDAQIESASNPGPVQRVVHAAILRHSAPRSELKEIVEEAGQLEVPRLERRLGMLATFAFLTPMLGLLGTVVGLIQAFSNMTAHNGLMSSADLSSGIYQSLLTTAAGLAVAIPCAVAYSYLSARVNSMMHDMERAGIEIVNLLVESRQQPEIIEFEGARQRAEGRV
jgi:biopolymer transport protein ExbB